MFIEHLFYKGGSMMQKEQLLALLSRLLDNLDVETLKLIYQFVLHVSK